MRDKHTRSVPQTTEVYETKNYKLWYDEDLGALRMTDYAPLTAEDAGVVLPLVNEMLKHKPHRYMVVDVSGIPAHQMIDKESRQAFRDASDPQDFEKVAIFGASPAMRMVAKVVLTVTGVSKITRFFKTEQEAVAWIKEKQ